MDIISGKRWRTEGKVSMLRDSEESSSILVLSSNPRTFRKYTQSCIARKCIVTERIYRVFFYHVENGKELRSSVNHGSSPGGVSLKTGRQAVFFSFVNPMDNQDGFGETLCGLSQAIHKYLETISEYNTLLQFKVRSTKRTSIFFFKQDQTQ